MESVVGKIKEEIFDQKLAVHCDESPWPIQDKKDNDGQMWVVSNQAGSFYQFESTRSGAVIEEILGEYRGPVLCAGYVGYNLLKKAGMPVAYCWAHVRRKFIEIEQNYPKECQEILCLMDQLFEIEKQAKSFKELKKLRRRKSRPVTAKTHEWLLKNKSIHLPQRHFTKAINYTLKHWYGLTLFLDHISVPLINNDAERALRHAVMGRKASMDQKPSTALM
jgi:hypothetical protein